MPTYDYECTKCGHQFEKFQSMSDPLLKTCPKCKGKVKRLIGAGAGLLFKGDGFYITDYRSKDYKEKSKSDAAPKVESSSSTPAAGDTGAGKSGASDTSSKPAKKASKKSGGAGKGAVKD